MSIDIVDYTDKINQLASCTLTYLIQFKGYLIQLTWFKLSLSLLYADEAQLWCSQKYVSLIELTNPLYDPTKNLDQLLLLDQ